MVTQINPALARIWLPGGTRQYGYLNPMAITDGSAGAHRALDFLEQGLSKAQTQQLHLIARTTEEEIANLINRLGPALKTSSTTFSSLLENEVQHHFAELARIYLESNEDPAAVLRQRRHARIFIELLDRTGITIARALSASFIGTFLSMDTKTVGEADILELGHRAELIGTNRVRSADLSIPGSKVELHSRISGAMDRVDLAVLVATDVTDPDSYQIWMTREIPHIAVVFDERGVSVSPVILPGITPCLACYERSRIRNNPDWITIGPQLLALERSLADSAMLLFASSQVANRALNLIDLGAAPEQQEFSVLSRAGELRAARFSATNCGCRLVQQQTQRLRDLPQS